MMRTRSAIEIGSLNTNQLSHERAWIKITIDKKWFHNNDQHKDNTIEATVKFLQEAKALADADGFIDVVVRPWTSEAEEFSLEQYYITVEGYRLETDAEYKKRLEMILFRDKSDVERVATSYKYHGSDRYKERQKQFTDAIAAIGTPAKTPKKRKQIA